MNLLLPIILLLCAALLQTKTLYGGEYYRWVDEHGVVHFTDNLHNIPRKQRGSAGRIQAQESAPAPVNAPRVTPTKASIPMEKQGQVVVIEATFNNKKTAKLVVDTGASYTMISQALARDLDIDTQQNRKTLPFQTANGTIEAPLTSLESISVGGMEIKNITAAVHDVIPGNHVAGLLGLNFLSNFKMDIDTRRGMLHLEKKP